MTVLETALEIANGNQIFLNRSEKFSQEMFDKYPKSKMYNSLYFTKEGIDFRISNHELPNRHYMQVSTMNGEPMKFYKNNVEIIVTKEGIKNKLNFNQ
jgi:hypothetical protein